MTLPDLTRYDRVDVDTETTGLTPRDRAVGISIFLPDGSGYYLRWGHEAGGNNCSRAEVVDWANRELRGKELTFFNAPFDLRMMAYDGIWLFENVAEAASLHDSGIQAPLYNELEPNFRLGHLSDKYLGQGKLDDAPLNAWCAELCGGRASTKAQVENYWRAPGDMVEPYAIRDAENAGKLRRFYGPKLRDLDLEGVYDVERHIIPMLLKMHLTGVKVNVPAAHELREKLKEEQRALGLRWCELTGEERFIDSGKRFWPHFKAAGLGHLIPETDAGNRSFDKHVLSKIDHPFSELIRALRKVKHFGGTFIQNYVLDNADELDLVHGEFHSVRNDRYGAVSGRFSSGGELNLQNIPKRDELWGPLIRGLFIPLSDDYDWAKADYSQIEYRFFAHFCGGRLVDLYVNDPNIDFHQMMADLTGHPRPHAKNMNFAALFGAGIAKLAQMLGSDIEEATRVLTEYHERAPEVKDLANKAQRRATARGFITTWGGRRHRFPKRGGGRHGMAHKALNRLCQGSAADLLKYAMRRVDQVIDWEHVICHLTVHDELDFSFDRGATGTKMMQEVRHAMITTEEMSAPQVMTVPVKVDVTLGKDWGHCDRELVA